MKVSKVEHHGQIRFRVNDPHGPDGKRQRKFFDTREAAEEYVTTRTADTKAFGVHMTTIPATERAALAYQVQRLAALGWTLPAAVDFIEKHGKAAPSKLLGTVADEFLAVKAASGLRPRYVKTLRASIHRFLVNRRNKLIGDVTPAEIQEYIGSNGWQPSTMRSYLVDVRTLFAFAMKRRNGAMRGTSRRQDAAFWVIQPSEAKDAGEERGGARFVSKFTKNRNTTDKNTPPLEWSITEKPESGTEIGIKLLSDALLFRECIEIGLVSASDIAEEMHISKGQVSKLAKRAMLAGWLTKDGREYRIVSAP